MPREGEARRRNKLKCVSYLPPTLLNVCLSSFPLKVVTCPQARTQTCPASLPPIDVKCKK